MAYLGNSYASYDIHVKNKHNGLRVDFTACSISNYRTVEEFINHVKSISPHLDVYLTGNYNCMSHDDVNAYSLDEKVRKSELIRLNGTTNSGTLTNCVGDAPSLYLTGSTRWTPVSGTDPPKTEIRKSKNKVLTLLC